MNFTEFVAFCIFLVIIFVYCGFEIWNKYLRRGKWLWIMERRSNDLIFMKSLRIVKNNQVKFKKRSYAIDCEHTAFKKRNRYIYMTTYKNQQLAEGNSIEDISDVPSPPQTDEEIEFQKTIDNTELFSQIMDDKSIGAIIKSRRIKFMDRLPDIILGAFCGMFIIFAILYIGGYLLL